MTLPNSSRAAQAYGGSDVANASQQEIRYRMEQRFSNFQKFDDVTLPISYVISYDLEGQRQAHQRYTNTFTNVVNNVQMDARNFEVK